MREKIEGAFGSSGSLALRLGQIVFSSASLCFMCFNFRFIYYSSFSLLVTVMGLAIPWSITLFVLDAYLIFIQWLPTPRRVIGMIVLGDMVLSYLSLAAACSTASVIDIMNEAGRSQCPAKSCTRYQLSASMAFLSWFCTSASCLLNFWLLPSLEE